MEVEKDKKNMNIGFSPNHLPKTNKSFKSKKYYFFRKRRIQSILSGWKILCAFKLISPKKIGSDEIST